jgi:hypothetical protein
LTTICDKNLEHLHDILEGQLFNEFKEYIKEQINFNNAKLEVDNLGSEYFNI